MVNNTLIEVCCGSLTDALTAISEPIDRIELNTALELGGLTVNTALLKTVKQHTDIPICCMVRTRTGGFCFSEEEFVLMLKQAEDLLQAGADGIVFGFLNEDCTVNYDYTVKMVNLIKQHGRQAVFHKAFDQTNMEEAVKVLIEAGVDRILTSGGDNYPDILAGADLMARLHHQYGTQIQILPGGGVRKENVAQLLNQTGLNQVHCSASVRLIDPTDRKTPYQAVNREKLHGILAAISQR